MKIAAIIPCYNVKNKIIPVVTKSLKLFDAVICVDDNCPQETYKEIKKKIKNSKLKIYKLEKNSGVGGATKFVVKKIYNKFDIICKIDGDNQFNPNDCYKITKKLLNSNYDYAKGNRFLNKKNKKNNPKIRWILNKVISLINKITTGNIYLEDPLNGFFAFKTKIIKKLNLNKVSNDFFFETDLLFNCSLSKLKIKEFSINIKYFKQHSNFKPTIEMINFAKKHLNRFFYRIWVQYFKNSFNFISLYIIIFFFTLLINYIYKLSINSFFFIIMIFFFNIFDFLKNKPT